MSAPDVKAVTCAFHGSFRGYDYLTDIDLSVGDKVVVASAYAPEENMGYGIAEVTVIGVPVVKNPAFEYKYVLAKIEGPVVNKDPLMGRAITGEEVDEWL